VNLDHLPNHGTICAPIRTKKFPTYSIDYVISRYRGEHFGARQFCVSVGLAEAKINNKGKLFKARTKRDIFFSISSKCLYLTIKSA
jgi:hypothetical protein